MKKFIVQIYLCVNLLAVSLFTYAEQSLAPFNPPNENTIPSGPLGASIRNGMNLVTNTRSLLPKNVGNGLNCSSCHLNQGRAQYASPFAGLWGVFPEYHARDAKVITLADRINECFERSMNGKALDYKSAEMVDFLSYMQWLSSGVPTGQDVVGRGFIKFNMTLTPNITSGKLLYSEKCSSCHGIGGTGISNSAGAYSIPPLWGNASFNDGAGMARTFTAAAFIRHNMPLGQPNSLTEQEALNIAEYFTHQPRPTFRENK